MTGLAQVAALSDFMFGLSENEIEALLSQSVTPSKKRLGTMDGVFTLLAGVKT